MNKFYLITLLSFLCGISVVGCGQNAGDPSSKSDTSPTNSSDTSLQEDTVHSGTFSTDTDTEAVTTDSLNRDSALDTETDSTIQDSDSGWNNAWFHTDPILVGVFCTSSAVNVSLMPQIVNPSGSSVTFEKIAGPNWLSVSSSGMLTGTPANHGTNVFEIALRQNGTEVDTAELNIQVNRPMPSPFGTGISNDVTLGALENASVVNAKYNWINYSVNLGTTLYDVYVPADYQGCEPYGLMGFVNSKNGGKPEDAYLETLDRQKIIWIGPQVAGNDQYISNRTGRVLIGMYRAMELFNINEKRVYVSGTSGGMRTVSALAFAHPEVITGVAGRVGSAFPEYLPQVYETKEPNSHYETVYFGSGINNTTFRNTPRNLGRRFAIITAFGDFREGDIFNIYHFGFERYGFISKVIDQPGGHSNSVTAHSFRDAVNFLEHPYVTLIDDHFDDGHLDTNTREGTGFSNLAIDALATESDGALILSPTGSDTASVVANDLFHWWDPYGAILRFSLAPENNSQIHIGVWSAPYTATDIAPGAALSNENLNGKSGIRITVSEDNGEEQVRITLFNPNHANAQYREVELFRGKFEKWPGSNASDWTSRVFNTDINTDTIDIKMNLWDDELNISFNKHISTNNLLDTYVTLLDDSRTIRIRFDGDEESTGVKVVPLCVSTDWNKWHQSSLTLACDLPDTSTPAGQCRISNAGIVYAGYVEMSQ